MTKWSEPDEYNCTGRNAGDYLLMAAKDGWWSVYDAESGKSWLEGEATDLASAQAAADAACERLLRDAMADFGLAFGPPDARWEHALATDFAGLYTLGASTHGDGRWVWGYESLNGSDDDVGAVYADDRDKAIAGARAHDEQRRGAK